LHAGPLGHRVHDGPHQIDVEVAGNALQHRGHALKAHARVDARPLQLRVRAVFVLMKLDKDQIPNLQITLAVVAARLALFVRAAELGAAVDVNLRARAARADADLPEVVLFAQAHDALLGDADLLMPDAGRLVVLPVDADPKPVLGHLHALGDELPRPGDGFALEIVPEREVAQHLEKRVVPPGVAYLIDVRRADAALARRNARVLRLALAEKVRLEGHHARRGQQQRRVVTGHQRRA